MASPTARLDPYRGQEVDVVLGFLGPQAHLTVGKGFGSAGPDCQTGVLSQSKDFQLWGDSTETARLMVSLGHQTKVIDGTVHLLWARLRTMPYAASVDT